MASNVPITPVQVDPVLNCTEWCDGLRDGDTGKSEGESASTKRTDSQSVPSLSDTVDDHEVFKKFSIRIWLIRS